MNVDVTTERVVISVKASPLTMGYWRIWLAIRLMWLARRLMGVSVASRDGGNSPFLSGPCANIGRGPQEGD